MTDEERARRWLTEQVNQQPFDDELGMGSMDIPPNEADVASLATEFAQVRAPLEAEVESLRRERDALRERLL